VRPYARVGGSPRHAPARRRKYAHSRVIVFTVVIGLMSSGWIAGASATTEVLHSTFKGLRADATFEWPAPPGSGCVTTDASVTAEQGPSMLVAGEPTHQPTVQLTIVTVTGCSFPALSGANGTAVLPPGAFQIDKTLGSAQLAATVQVADGNSKTIQVGLHVVWAGTGALNSLTNHSHVRFPGATTTVENVTGVSRAATATGTLTQLGAGAAVSAGLSDVSYSFLTIVH